jgi:integrase
MAGTVRKRTWVTRKGQKKTAWAANYPDQSGTWRLKTFTTKKAADAWLTDTQHELKRGVHTPERDSITVADAAELWLERGRLAGLERGSLRHYATTINLHIVPFVGAVKLARLTAPMVVEFRDELLRQFSRQTTRLALSRLRTIITEMQRRGLVAQNVVSAVRVDLRKREQPKLAIGRDVPSKAEVQQLLAHAQGWWRVFFLTAIFTGMRASELRGLTWADVDFKRRCVSVRQRADQWGTIGRPKSAAGERTIPLVDYVVNSLREWRVASHQSEAELVFSGPHGVYSHTPLLERWWAQQRAAGVVDAAGEPKYGLHKLRHFFASWAIEQGFSAMRLQEMLGHSSVKMTFDVYGHLFPSNEDDQARLSEGARTLLGG